MTERTGVLFSLRDDPSLVRLAEKLGYESVWTAEGQGKTAFGNLEHWATVTEEIQLATGIVNIFSRTPATLAAAAATLDAHSNGRVILGLGVAHPGVVEEFHGVDFDRPLTRMAEYVELTRRYLRGDPEEFDGEFYSPRRTQFWEAFDPIRDRIPIYNAALGSSNVRLTGEQFDGWLPNLYPPEYFQEALGWLEDGAANANRSREDLDVAMYVLVAVDDNPKDARQAVASHVAYYLRDIPGYYGRVAENAGFADEVAAVRNAQTTAAAAGKLSDDFLDVVSVTGTAAEVRAELGEFRDSGVDLPIVRAPASTDHEATQSVVEACAPVD